MERRIKGKVKGKAIIGIAVAAIMLASLMAAIVPTGMSEDDPIVIPVPPDGKIQIDLTQNIGKEVVLVAEQLTLAGTMLEIAGTEGVCEVKEVLLKVVVGGEDHWVSTEKLSYPLGVHTINVVYENLKTQKVLDRLMKVKVADRTPPTINVKVEPSTISADEGMFGISVDVMDNCDAAPTVDAVMMLPSLEGLKIEQKEAKEVMLEIDLKEMKAELKGPAAIREAMMEAMMKDGVMLVMMQEQQIDIQVEKGKDALKYEYKYDEKGMLKIQGSGMEVLTVKAMDASGNLREQVVMLALEGM